MSAPDDRSRYIDGLRVLASVLEQNPDLPLPDNCGTHDGIPVRWFFVHGCDDPKAEMAAVRRALPCSWRKHVSDENPDTGTAWFDLRGRLGGLYLELTAARDAVCTRVVTGTREVTEEVPDPDALATVPKVKVTRTVEDVEWECSPLLSPVAASRPMALAAAPENGTAAAGEGGGQ